VGLPEAPEPELLTCEQAVEGASDAVSFFWMIAAAAAKEVERSLIDFHSLVARLDTLLRMVQYALKRQDGRHSPEAVLRGVLGRTYPEEVLSRVLYATQFTRSLDVHGYVRFKNWRFFGEDGLAEEEVSVWMYEGTVKIEYQTTTLSEYTVRFSPDHKSIEQVKHGSRIETHFVSPQLHLWRRGEIEWLLALKQPERSKWKSKRGQAHVVQLRFPEMQAWWEDQAL